MVIQGISYPSDFEAKKSMIAAASKLEAKGCMVAGDGSLSVRVGPNAIWITVEGADKFALTQDQMVRIDLNGKQMATNKPKPLAPDLEAHLKIYRENDSVQAVVHAYPVCAVVLGAKGHGVEAAGFSPSVRKLGRIQLTHASDPQGAAEEIALLCKTDKGAVIPNDGCMMWGRSVREAVSLVEALEFSCKASKCLGCGKEHAGISCGAQAQTSYCSGNCSSCEKASACPDCRQEHSFRTAAPVSEPVPAPQPIRLTAPVNESVLPAGMTGLIRPGSPLPPLPEETAKPAAIPAAPAMPAPAANMSAVKGTASVSDKPDLVIHTPKADVMAEVVRRSMKQ